MSVLALVTTGAWVSVAGTGVKVPVGVGRAVDVSVGLAVDAGVSVSVIGHSIVTVGRLQARIIPTKKRPIGTIGERILRIKSLPG